MSTVKRYITERAEFSYAGLKYENSRYENKGPAKNVVIQIFFVYEPTFIKITFNICTVVTCVRFAIRFSTEASLRNLNLTFLVTI